MIIATSPHAIRHPARTVPGVRRPGHVEPSDINESAPTAGLQQTSTVNAGKDWTAARLVAPRAARSRR